MSYDKQIQKIDAVLQKTGSKGVPADTQVRIYSEKLGIDYRYESESTRPYHAASVGKIFVVALLVQMAKEGKLSLDKKISELFFADDLVNLFAVEDKDYSSEVTVRQLASHTSGINDYFESKSSNASSFIDKVITDSDHSWTPDELLDYTRKYQKAVAVPGAKFFYSDTGYVLLGKVLEKVCGLSYGELLTRQIFDPLGMKDSYLYGFSAETTTQNIAPLYVKGVDISGMKSLSCDWSGGGVITTTDDLLRFQIALHNGKFGNLVAEQAGFPNKFRRGMHYGFGMMELHLNEFLFLLKGLPNMKGHIGVTSTHTFYDDINDVHLVLNFGSDKRMVDSFKTLIKIVQILKMKAK